MRERVTENIPADELDVQLKLGPGGLRDVEFTIQLLQLVHGQADPAVRQRATLDALVALADQGYIGRVEAAEFGHDYRILRLIEHRLQLARLRRTHLMPTQEDALRVLARATGLATSADGIVEQWQRTKLQVRRLHERLFYRPLLSAVAALPEEGFALTSDQAEARLAAIGFRDPRGALHHIAALTGGVSRRATIQRNLLPVMLQWFAEGADPDYGLLAFRRLSDDLGETPWFLRNAAGLVGRRAPPHQPALRIAVRRLAVRAHPRSRRLAGERRGAPAAQPGDAGRGGERHGRQAPGRSGCGRARSADRPPPGDPARRDRGDARPGHDRGAREARSVRSPRRC